jgi:hypothetical protein
MSGCGTTDVFLGQYRGTTLSAPARGLKDRSRADCSTMDRTRVARLAPGDALKRARLRNDAWRGGAAEIERKAVVLLDVAAAAVQRGRYSRAAELGHDALSQASTRKTRLIKDRLRSLHGMIRDKRDVAVLVDLNDRLLAHLS